MTIEKQIEELRGDIKETNGEIKELSKIVLRVETYVVGDSQAGVKGYGTRITDLEKESKAIQKLKWYVAGVVAAITLLINLLF